MTTNSLQVWTRNLVNRAAINAFLAGQTIPKAKQTLAERLECNEGSMTAYELAKLLVVSRVTLFKMAKRGRIPSFSIGTCVRFDLRQVAAWLKRM